MSGKPAPPAQAPTGRLFDADDLYRLLVEQVQDYAIFALDPAGNVRTWNPGAQRFKGYSPDEIIGKNFSVFYTAEDKARGRPQELLSTAARVGRAEDEGWRVRKDGSRFWASVLITALRDARGSLIGFAKITRDLTERRAADERARRLAVAEAAHAATAAKAQELELLNARLQDQAVELEAQTEEAQSLAEELEQANEQLQTTLTEVEQAREAEKAAERFSRTILESISDPFVVLDGEWRYRFINAPAAKWMEPARGSKPQDLIGKNIWTLYPDIVGTPFERNLKRAVELQKPTTFEAYYPARGEWSSMQCYPLPEGGVAVQWRDISERKRTEEANHYLARASEILNRSLDYRVTLNDLAKLVVPELADWCAVAIADDKGDLQQLAVAHADRDKVRLGHELNERYPPRPDAPTGPYRVMRTGKPELYEDITDEMLASGAVDDEHLQILREVGLKSAMLVPLRVVDHPVGVLTLVSAESGRRYNQADLALAMELAHRAAIAVENARLHADALDAWRMAEDANRAKTDFLAMMSHELRTPLNAISGYTSLLRMGVKGPVSEEQEEYLARIERSGRHLLSLIQDVLSFAKLEAGRVEVTVDDVPVHPILVEMESLTLPQMREAKLTLVVDTCDPGLRVRADAERLRQVLLNLFSNAIKFTPEGGTVSLGCVTDEEHAYISVADTGPGIPPDKREAIFEPFVQLQRQVAGSQAGTGLGLSISRELAHAMNGDLLVESEVGRGSKFTIVLERSAGPT
jgi:PAS domain S-box-containing protein